MRTDPHRPRVLFITNGHGEDSIAATLIDRLRLRDASDAEIHAWPMVGLGDAFRRRDVPIHGVSNTLPSEGFATLSSTMLWRDLRAGWISTHWLQVRAARAMRGMYDLVVAVGDIVPVIAARLTHVPFVFVGCAKSDHYAKPYRYRGFEVALLRRALTVFPRDALTSDALARRGVRVRSVGNPMMDEVQPRGDAFDDTEASLAVACLPGSRRDAARNAARILDVLTALGERVGDRPVRAIFALPRPFDVSAVGSDASWRRVESPEADAISDGIVMRMASTDGKTTAVFAHDRLADALHRADIVIGLAGTANEQAVGLGKPLVTFATDGSQGRDYLRMKMTYFGDAACEISPEPAQAARAIADLLADPARCARMAAAGRERMGGPGATDAIVTAILDAAANRPIA